MSQKSLTPADRRWCIDTIVRISDFLPTQYSLVAQERLRKQGIEVSRRYITDCKNLKRYNVTVVSTLEQMVRDLNKLPRISNREDIRRRKI
jgi:hypothetical protein